MIKELQLGEGLEAIIIESFNDINRWDNISSYESKTRKDVLYEPFHMLSTVYVDSVTGSVIELHHSGVKVDYISASKKLSDAFHEMINKKSISKQEELLKNLKSKWNA